jgi:tRNA pseudouridine55 synthase
VQQRTAGIIDLDGGQIILIDKPAGWTSHDVVAKVRRITGVKKVGHAGTLDPMATGLLVVGVGKAATRKLAEGLEGGKHYRAGIRLGIASDTLDMDSETVRSVIPEFSRSRIEKILERLAAAGHQTPPMISALKRRGVSLMKLARHGWWIEREPRDVSIESLKLIDVDDAGHDVTIEVAGGGGLYIRALADDIGAALGVPAALTALRRTAVGAFQVDDAISLEQLEVITEQEIE